MAVSPKLIYKFNIILMRIPGNFFVFKETDRLILKLDKNHRATRIAKTILKKNLKSWRAYTTKFQNLL